MCALALTCSHKSALRVAPSSPPGPLCSPLPSLFFFSLFLPLSSPHTASAYPSLVLHSVHVLHLHCGCQSAGGMEELVTGLSLACLRLCGQVLPKGIEPSEQSYSCHTPSSLLSLANCLNYISALDGMNYTFTFSKCYGSLRSYLFYSVSVCNPSPCLSAIVCFPPK